MNLASFERFAGKRTVELQQKSQGTEAVIYTRVSSKEQADKNLSLETQRKAIEEYARRYELPVAAYFGGTYESAKTDGRKEFQRMLQFIQQHSGRIGQILVYTLDRFSRTGGSGHQAGPGSKRKIRSQGLCRYAAHRYFQSERHSPPEYPVVVQRIR